MKLYHGSNLKVEEPRIIESARVLDFGAAFYTTSSYEQASRWAILQARRRRDGSPVVSIYEFDEDSVTSSLSILKFAKPGKEWLEFITQNRTDRYVGKQYDVVIGPVANDNTIPVISDYIAGIISEDTALILLLPQKLKDQYAFQTLSGIGALKFVRGESL